MTGFKISSEHDLIIENNDFVLINGTDLLIQTVECVVGTNKGEWFLNENMGIAFATLLVKHPNIDMVKSEIIDALHQVDTSFVLEDFKFNVENRKLSLQFTASNEAGKLPINVEY